MSGSQAPEQLKQSMQQQQQLQQQNPQAQKRQLPFSMKPPFMAPGGDYHRFASTEPRRIADQESDAIVVKSPERYRSIERFNGLQERIEFQHMNAFGQNP